MKSLLITIGVLSLFLSSCDRIKSKSKETINKGGEAVGKSATEFFEGVSEGVDKTLKPKIMLSEDLKEKGLSLGNYDVANDTSGGDDNLLSLYIIFENNFSGNLLAKAYNKQNLEIGRSKLLITEKAGEANYFDFRFHKRTSLEAKSKVVIEQVP